MTKEPNENSTAPQSVGASESTPANNCCGDDSHHHATYTGQEIVSQLGTGYAIASIALPVAVIIVFFILSATIPGTFAPFACGLALGVLQYLANSIAAFNSTRRSMSGKQPSLVHALLSAITQEALRVGVVALAGFMFINSGVEGRQVSTAVWLAFGAVFGQTMALTASEITSRRAMLKPGAWSQNQVEYVLALGVSGHAVTARRMTEHLLAALWTMGATLLVYKSIAMLIPLIALTFGLSLISLMLQSKSIRDRLNSPLTYFGPLVSLLIFGLGIVLARSITTPLGL